MDFYDIRSRKNCVGIYHVVEMAFLKPEYHDKLLDWLGNEELHFHALVAHFSPDVNYLFPQEIIDDLMDHLLDLPIRQYGTYVEASGLMFTGDPSAYPPDGRWSADLFEFLGHYIWIEPEGEEKGFFKTLEEARAFGATYWG